jgi:hypothetical protein
MLAHKSHDDTQRQTYRIIRMTTPPGSLHGGRIGSTLVENETISSGTKKKKAIPTIALQKY